MWECHIRIQGLAARLGMGEHPLARNPRLAMDVTGKCSSIRLSVPLKPSNSPAGIQETLRKTRSEHFEAIGNGDGFYW